MDFKEFEVLWYISRLACWSPSLLLMMGSFPPPTPNPPRPPWMLQSIKNAPLNGCFVDNLPLRLLWYTVHIHFPSRFSGPRTDDLEQHRVRLDADYSNKPNLLQKVIKASYSLYIFRDYVAYNTTRGSELGPFLFDLDAFFCLEENIRSSPIN